MRRDNGWLRNWDGRLAILLSLLAIALLLTGCALRDLATPPRPLYPPCADSAATRDSTTGRCRASADTTEVGR